MEYSRNYEWRLENAFLRTRPEGLYSISASNFHYFGEFGNLVVDLSSDVVTVPTIAVDSLLRLRFSTNILNADNNKIIIGLHQNRDEMIVRRTADSIIKEFALYNRSAGGLLPVRTAKGEIFYGGAGIIMDSKKRVLLLNTVEYNIMKNLFTKAVIYANPCVLNKDNLITKSIIGKVIPFFVTYKRRVRFDSGSGNTSLPVEVVFKDMSHILQFPKPPSMNADEELGSLLLDNIDDVYAAAECL